MPGPRQYQENRYGESTGLAGRGASKGIRSLEFDSKSLSAREPAAELWRRTLSQIPTVFGRLVYLASLRDNASNHYAHSSLTSLLGPEGADRTLRHSHHQVFSEWISFRLAEQKADLDEYIRTSGGRAQVFHVYRNLVPPAARDVERQLYLTDLETLLELLRYGGAANGGSGA